MNEPYILSKDAENDLRDILAYTLENFGESQVHKYTSLLDKCLKQLSNKKAFYKIAIFKGNEVMIQRCSKHYIFALDRSDRPILVLAIFHEQMDLMDRLKNRLV